eukprot:5983201-Lingulodinium_polyedra.AAC.1
MAHSIPELARTGLEGPGGAEAAEEPRPAIRDAEPPAELLHLRIYDGGPHSCVYEVARQAIVQRGRPF